MPLEDLRGVPDADGRVMRSTVRAVADEIASAAELALGKTAGRPVAIVRGAPFTRGEGSIADVVMPARERPLPLRRHDPNRRLRSALCGIWAMGLWGEPVVERSTADT